MEQKKEVNVIIREDLTRVIITNVPVETEREPKSLFQIS